ncbi:MAG: trypsin-like peptidase domain-containing protein, partial [Clostridia bacterium]|nr:trypsin-like peptidase domain-containing protein [Clostridia bacterium]
GSGTATSIGSINKSNSTDAANKSGTQAGTSTGDTNVTIVDSTSNYVEAVAAKVTPSVVGVSVTFTYNGGFFSRGSNYETQASGVIYSSDGYIITNYHVIEYAITYSGSVSVYLPSDPKTAIPAAIVGYDASYDLAVLKIDRTGLPAITVGSSSNLTLGQHVVVIGNPDGLEFMGSVSVGYLSGINRTIYIDSKSYNVIQTDAAINPGNSGGAMVDSEGRLIGIVNAKRVSEEYESMGFAIPVDTVVEICQGLITSSGKPTSYIGVRIDQNYSASYLEANGYPRGIVVSTVIEGSPAETAGIQRYDIITEADGQAIDSYDKLISVLKKHTIGEPMTIKVYRSGKTLTFTVTPIASNG